MRSSYGALLDALRGVRWPARRTVAAGAPGTHRSTQRGTSGEFTEYRLYRQGDDPRALDWKLLARSDRAFIRLTDDRAVLPTWFVVDASGSMAFPSADAVDGKWGVARALTIGLAAVAHGGADPVGLLVATANGMRQLSARTRRGTITAMASVLDDAPCVGVASVAPLLAYVPTRARIVLISDALGDDEPQRRAAAPLITAGAQVVYVHVVAADELDPGAATFAARDPESLRIGAIYRDADKARYQESFDAFRNEVAEGWRRIGAAYCEVRTDADLPHAVRRIIAAGVGSAG